MSNPSRSPKSRIRQLHRPDTFRRIELITGVARRRASQADVKAAIVMETLENGARVSEVARRHGIAAALVFKWRREMRCPLAPAAAGFAQIAVEPAPSRGRQKCPKRRLLSKWKPTAFAYAFRRSAGRDAIMAVMEGLAAMKRRR